MNSSNRYDVLVIGVGMAGVSVAHKAARSGKRVAVVDSTPYGGTCALRGCDPKKVLVGAADLIDWSRRMSGPGVEGELTIDWPALMKHKESIIENTPGSREQSRSKLGVETLHGSARFTGRNRIMVNDREVDAEHIVISVGQRPRTLGFPGAEHVITSTDFLDLPELPKRIVFVGGGLVSMEFAHVAARAGAEVIVLQRGHHILKGFDPDLADRLTEVSREVGIDIRLNTKIAEVDRSANGESLYTVTTPDRMEIEADLVVHGAGRVPELDELDLCAGEIAFDSMRGVTVNEFLQGVSNTALYAAGDAADTAGQKLTPVCGPRGDDCRQEHSQGQSQTP